MASPVFAILLEEGGPNHQIISQPKSHRAPTDTSSLTYIQLLTSLDISRAHEFKIQKIVYAEQPYAYVMLHHPHSGMAPRESRVAFNMKDLKNTSAIVCIHLDSNSTQMGAPRAFFPITDVDATLRVFIKAKEVVKVDQDVQITALSDGDDGDAADDAAAFADTPVSQPWIPTPSDQQLAHRTRQVVPESMDTDDAPRPQQNPITTIYIGRATKPPTFVMRKFPTDDPAFLRWLVTVLGTTIAYHVFHSAEENKDMYRYKVWYGTNPLEKTTLPQNIVASKCFRPTNTASSVYKGTVVVVKEKRHGINKWVPVNMERPPQPNTYKFNMEKSVVFDYNTTGKTPPSRIDPDIENDAAAATQDDDTIRVNMITQFGKASIKPKVVAALQWAGGPIPDTNTFNIISGGRAFTRAHLPLAEGALPAGITAEPNINAQADFLHRVNTINTKSSTETTHFLVIFPKTETNSVVVQYYDATIEEALQTVFNGATYTADLCNDAEYPNHFQYLVFAAHPRDPRAQENTAAAAYYGLTKEAGLDNMYGKIAIARIAVNTANLAKPTYRYIQDIHKHRGSLWPLFPVNFSPRRKIISLHNAIGLPAELYPSPEETTAAAAAEEEEEEEEEEEGETPMEENPAETVAAEDARVEEETTRLQKTTTFFKRDIEPDEDAIEDTTVYYMEPGSKKEKARPIQSTDQTPYNQAEIEANIEQIPITIEEQADKVPFDSCNANRTIIPDTINIVDNAPAEEQDLKHMRAPELVNCYISRAGKDNEKGFIKRRFPLYETAEDGSVSRDFSAAFTAWCTCLLRSQNHEYHLLTHIHVPPKAETDPSAHPKADEIIEVEQGVQYLVIMASSFSIEVTPEATAEDPDPETTYKISRPPVNEFFSQWAQISPIYHPDQWVAVKGNAIVIRIYSTAIFSTQFVPFNNDDLSGEALNTYVMAQSNNAPLDVDLFPIADDACELTLDTYGKKARRGTNELNERVHDTSVELTLTPAQIRKELLTYWGKDAHDAIKETKDEEYRRNLREERAILQDQIRNENARNEQIANESKKPWVRKYIPCNIDGVPIDPARDLIPPNPIKIINPETDTIDTSLITAEMWATIDAERSNKAAGIGPTVTHTNQNHPQKQPKASRRVPIVTRAPRSDAIILDDDDADLPHKPRVDTARANYAATAVLHPHLVNPKARIHIPTESRKPLFASTPESAPKRHKVGAEAAPAEDMETDAAEDEADLM